MGLANIQLRLILGHRECTRLQAIEKYFPTEADSNEWRTPGNAWECTGAHGSARERRIIPDERNRECPIKK